MRTASSFGRHGRGRKYSGVVVRRHVGMDTVDLRIVKAGLDDRRVVAANPDGNHIAAPTCSDRPMSPTRVINPGLRSGCVMAPQSMKTTEVLTAHCPAKLRVGVAAHCAPMP
jgi:hypothetical protein